MNNAARKFDVEYYLKFKSERIDSTCQYEAQRLKLDFDIVKKHSIQEMRRKSEEYDDSMGTSGFIRFFTNIVYSTCTMFIKNPSIYQGLIADRDIHKQTGNLNKDEVKILNTDDRLDNEEMRISLKTEETMMQTVVTQEVIVKIGEKICADCKTPKPYSDFYRHKQNKDGYSHICKGCHVARYGAGGRGKDNPKRVDTPRTVKSESGQASEFGFDNQDIDVMILLLQPKLELAKADVIKAKQEVERIMQLITKLERRKKV